MHIAPLLPYRQGTKMQTGILQSVQQGLQIVHGVWMTYMYLWSINLHHQFHHFAS